MDSWTKQPVRSRPQHQAQRSHAPSKRIKQAREFQTPLKSGASGRYGRRVLSLHRDKAFKTHTAEVPTYPPVTLAHGNQHLTHRVKRNAYSVPCPPGTPRIGRTPSHRMRRSESCRHAPHSGYAKERIARLHIQGGPSAGAPPENALSLRALLCGNALRAAGYTGSAAAPASVRSATPQGTSTRLWTRPL